MRAGAENEIVCFLVEVVEARDVAGKQVGRELDAVKLQTDGLCK